MMILNVEDTPVGKVREGVMAYSRSADRGSWSSWYRMGWFKDVEAAREAIKSEAARDTTLGGFIQGAGVRQFMLRASVETTLEVWDSSAKKILPTKRKAKG